MPTELRPFPFSDLTLARHLERAEGRSNTRFVEARAKLFTGSGPRWIEVAGAYAMFDGTASLLTQTFALGLFQPAAAADMAELALFDARLRDAAVRGCDLGMIGASPTSHRTCRRDRA